MKIVINYLPSRRSKPVRPSFIFETQIKDIFDEIGELSDPAYYIQQRNYHDQGPERYSPYDISDSTLIF